MSLTDHKNLEALLLTGLEPLPIAFRDEDELEVPKVRAAIKRGAGEKQAVFREPVNRNAFLCACLDYTEHAEEEHLIVGYGYRYGQTTKVEHLHHVVGEERRVAVPVYVRSKMQQHYLRRTNGEIIVFHNHPRLGTEGNVLYALKSIVEDVPIASQADRTLLQSHTINPTAFLRQIAGQGRILFFIGESGYVKQFALPPLLKILREKRQE